MLKENMKIFSRTSDLIINLNLKETNNISKAVRKKAGSNGKTKPPLILKPIWFWSFIFFFVAFIYLQHTCTGTHMHVRAHGWKTGQLLGDGSLPHYVDLSDWTQVVKLVSKCFYLPSHLIPSFTIHQSIYYSELWRN